MRSCGKFNWSSGVRISRHLGANRAVPVPAVAEEVMQRTSKRKVEALDSFPTTGDSYRQIHEEIVLAKTNLQERAVESPYIGRCDPDLEGLYGAILRRLFGARAPVRAQFVIFRVLLPGHHLREKVTVSTSLPLNRCTPAVRRRRLTWPSTSPRTRDMRTTAPSRLLSSSTDSFLRPSLSVAPVVLLQSGAWGATENVDLAPVLEESSSRPMPQGKEVNERHFELV